MLRNDVTRLTKQIHKFVRHQLTFEDELQLLNEIIDSQEWMQLLETEILLYEAATHTLRKKLIESLCLN